MNEPATGGPAGITILDTPAWDSLSATEKRWAGHAYENYPEPYMTSTTPAGRRLLDGLAERGLVRVAPAKSGSARAVVLVTLLPEGWQP